jgi:hypothetical protein
VTTILKTTPELAVGDIVQTHGMRVLLDLEPVHMRERWPGERARYFVGRVLNPDDPEVTRTIPRSWLWENGIGQPVEYATWTIQGNEFAQWAVEEVRSA